MLTTLFLTLRAILALVLIAWSCLVFLRARKIFLFQLTIGATEYGHWFALLAFLLAAVGDHHTWLGIITTALLIIAALLFLWPLAQAFHFARSVPAIWGGPKPALSFWKLWTGTSVAPVPSQTLIYATHGEEKLRLLFFPATRPAPAPCVIVLHTGGWASGSPDEFTKWNSWLAGQGYAVASMQYRLAPRWTWPAQRDDLLDVLQYLKTHHAAHGIDPARFVLLGRSAGGQIAKATAYGHPDPAIRGVISLYAPADLHFAYKYAIPGDILDSPTLLKDYLGGTPDQARDNYDSGSAIQLVTPQAPPTLLLHGLRDEMVWMRQNRRLAPVLEKNGVRHLYLEFPWATHAFDWHFDGPGGQITRHAIAHFLADVTSP